jgi:radical SAM superfamily enzyme YgiQ (UPF0313 family)
MTIKRVHFVELNARLNTLATTPVFPKYGTPLLATIVKEQGYDVRIFLDGVSDMRFERISDCDVICMPVFAPAFNKVKELARRLERERPGVTVIMGGPHVCMYTDTVLDLCDYAVRCEGDEVLPDLLACLDGAGDPRAVAGVSYIRNGTAIHNPDRAPPEIPRTIPDMTLIDGLERVSRSRVGRKKIVNTLQTSRGCRFQCRFCPTPRLFGGVYRNRDIDSIVAEIRARMTYNPFFFVVDNSFLSNRERTKELLLRLARERLGAYLCIFERHEIARDVELLRLMRRAGVRSIIVGIESLVDANLRSYNKEQSSAKVRRSIERILEQDIHVIGTFVLGGDADTPETAQQIVDFVDETGISPNLFVMHDVEERPDRKLLIPLSRRFKTHYRRTDPSNTNYYDYATGNFVSYFPKRMRPSTLQLAVVDVYRQLFTIRKTLRRMFARDPYASTFGINHGFSMLRLNEVIARVAEGPFLDHLRQLERGLYDGEALVEERLASLGRVPLPPPLEDTVDLSRFERLSNLCVVPGLIRLHMERRRSERLPPVPLPDGAGA